MLSLLLDEHLSPRIAQHLVRHRPTLKVFTLKNWLGTSLLGASDEKILRQARKVNCTLVTYDLRTVVPLLTSWSHVGLSHAGVILIDAATIAPEDIGGLVKALMALWDERGGDDRTDRVVYSLRVISTYAVSGRVPLVDGFCDTGVTN